MLLALAWKNVWRNTRRSAIMMTAIALGLWGGLFAIGIFTGMYDAMVNTAIDRTLGHAQVHARGFLVERDIARAIPEAGALASALRTIPGIAAVSPRTVIEGMGSSPSSALGVRILGVDPAAERAVTAVARRMKEGSFFEGSGRIPAVIGRKLAVKLDVRLRSKIVLSFQRPDGSLVYGAFRVAGIFDTESSVFDGQTVFVRRPDLDALAGVPLVHEIAVRLERADSLAAAVSGMRAVAPGLEVLGWKELAPELKLTAESTDLTAGILLGIILLALLFGITNTMLMSVLDRVREFGVLMAVGMRRRKLFSMIVLETLFLAISGSVAGTGLGIATIAVFARRGIDLAWFSDGLSLYGISSMLYPVLHGSTYPLLGCMVVLASCIAALYPAMKAIRLHPASAISTFG
jgi:putative ABC transport system permease protein